MLKKIDSKRCHFSIYWGLLTPDLGMSFSLANGLLNLRLANEWSLISLCTFYITFKVWEKTKIKYLIQF